MKQKQFETQYGPLWEQITAQLAAKGESDPARFPAQYRQLCQSLALARQRGYSPSLTDYLHSLVLAAHRQLYGVPAERPLTLRHWLGRELPQRVRQEWRLLLLALLAFWGVGLAVGLQIWLDPQSAYSWSTAPELNKFQQMYSNKASLGRQGSADDIAMFGFYIWNNVSICFRTFAGGLFLGIPALISLVFNGMHAGVIGSWLSQSDGTRINFWSFVVTHSSFEITGLILSGLAGLRLGLALIHPGRLSRRQSLMAASQRMYPVLVGAALLTFLAAFFEAFWSASASVPPSLKFTVGGICWAAVIGFFVFAGRGHHADR
ncbi:stage II sporulation protein M [Chitinimonas naiadis]